MKLYDLIKLQGKIIDVKGYTSPFKIVFDETMSCFMLENENKTRIFLYKEEKNLDKEFLAKLIDEKNDIANINDEILFFNNKWDNINKNLDSKLEDFELER